MELGKYIFYSIQWIHLSAYNTVALPTNVEVLKSVLVLLFKWGTIHGIYIQYMDQNIVIHLFLGFGQGHLFPGKGNLNVPTYQDLLNM